MSVMSTLARLSPLLVAASAGAARVDDSRYARLAPGEYARELAAQGLPEIPFKPFSPAFVKKALATPTNWTARGAVSPVKDQGGHGYCGTFGRVAACEGQFAIKTGELVSFSEEMLIDCIGWDQDREHSVLSVRGAPPVRVLATARESTVVAGGNRRRP